MNRVQAGLIKLLRSTPPWWLWPSCLLAVGASSFAAALLFAPGPDEWVYVLGQRFGDDCGFTTVTGQPCPQCGMTRSWVWAARLNFVKSFFYNPAGLALFLWVQAAAVVGLVRLVTRNPRRLEPPWQLLVSWTLFWTFGLYVVPWLLRVVLGLNPLPIP